MTRVSWLDCTLGDMLDMQAERYGDHKLICFKGSTDSYRQVKDRVDALAKAFIDIGIKKGENVAIWVPNCREWIYAWFALAKIGAVIAPLNTRFKTHEVEYILRQSDSSTLITIDNFLKIDFVQMVYELCPELLHSKPETFQSQKFPCLRRVICLGNKEYDGMFDFWELIKQGGRSQVDLNGIQCKVSSDDTAILQYTSGTTAFPKGAMLRHGAILQMGFCVGQRWLYDEQSRICSFFPFYHNGGTVLTMMSAMTHGATVWEMEYWNAEDAMKLIEEDKCTYFLITPTPMSDIFNHPNFNKYDLSSLRVVLESGLPRWKAMVAKTLGVDMVEVYGLTECSPDVCVSDLRDPLQKRIERIGKALPSVEVKIVDETGQALPHGKVGEIWVRGWNVMKGYYKNPELTAETVDKDGWLHTGDLGMLDEEGYLNFKGRLKEAIRTGGENISAKEVEDFLCEHPAIEQAAVIPVPDKRMGEVVFAFIKLKDGEGAVEQDIIDFCKGRIAGFKIPKYVKFVEEMPMTGIAHVQKSKLREMLTEEERVWEK